MSSPYDRAVPTQWQDITSSLVASHPLRLSEIRDLCSEAWDLVWKTTVGEGAAAFPLAEADPPAQVVGYFFEKLLARLMARRFPGEWRGCTSKDEKDLVYIPDASKSVEVKSSGQLGTKIFGNRSYGQKGTKARTADKPEKSGYYITVNFHGSSLMLLRFGWLDESDWNAQDAPTGQAAGLSAEVYKGKLIEIAGDYQLNAPIGLLDGVGPRRVEQLATEGIKSIRDLMSYAGSNLWIKRLRENAAPRYSVPDR